MKKFTLTIETLHSSEEYFEVTKDEWVRIAGEFQSGEFARLEKDGLIRLINGAHVTEFNISKEVYKN